MTHEFIDIVEAFKQASLQNIPSVLATVVELNGSSYRKPGVRMLISKNGQMTGAVSGGCVEKEIERQAQTVFNTGVPKIMTYDGRYRLGCEGLIYILIERFEPSNAFLNAFKKTVENRLSFTIESHYSKTVGTFSEMGSQFHFDGKTYALNSNHQHQDGLSVFKQTLNPRFRLLIFGHEHDAVELCNFSVLCGWEVDVFTSSPEIKNLDLFSKAHKITHILPNEIQQLKIDSETAIVLMTHNFAKDLAYLLELGNRKNYPCYIGVLGSKKRMFQLESALFEHFPNLDDSFVERIHGPAGLNIGSITPQEIAVSILGQITQLVRIGERKTIEI